MKDFRIVFIFSFALLFILGCSKEEIQPDPLNASDNPTLNSDESALKGANARHGKHKAVPFKATFELAAYFKKFGPIYRIDMETDWPSFSPPVGGMHIEIKGSGKATHMGKTTFEIVQWWTRKHTDPPLAETGFWSYGQGEMTFTAANGDKLSATYWGWADHRDDSDGTEILTFGTFTGGTGRFVGATGNYTWDGLFTATFKPEPGDETLSDTPMGNGVVKVTGSIRY